MRAWKTRKERRCYAVDDSSVRVLEVDHNGKPSERFNGMVNKV